MTKENNQQFVFYSDKLSYKTVEGAKGKEYFVEGYISTGDIDLVNDVVTKSCMDNMFDQFDGRTIKLDFEHETFRGKSKLDAEANKTRIPLGKAVGKSRDATGVKVKWKMNPTWKKFDEKGNVTMTFKDIWENVESEMYDAFSIAYVPTRTTDMQQQGKSVRMLDQINLLNVALTGNPINPGASMTAVMAKSLAFMNEQKSDDLENIEIKDRILKIESAVAEIKSNLSDSNIDNKIMGCKPMVKTKDETPEAEVQSSTPKAEGSEPNAEGAKPAVVAEAKPVAEVKPAEPEAKAMTLVDLKSVVDVLTKDIEQLKKENADLKAIVEKPLHKSKGAENQEVKSTVGSEAKGFVGPMDLI